MVLWHSIFGLRSLSCLNEEESKQELCLVGLMCVGVEIYTHHCGAKLLEEGFCFCFKHQEVGKQFGTF